MPSFCAAQWFKVMHSTNKQVHFLFLEFQVLPLQNTIYIFPCKRSICAWAPLQISSQVLNSPLHPHLCTNEHWTSTISLDIEVNQQWRAQRIFFEFCSSLYYYYYIYVSEQYKWYFILEACSFLFFLLGLSLSILKIFLSPDTAQKAHQATFLPKS